MNNARARYRRIKKTVGGIINVTNWINNFNTYAIVLFIVCSLFLFSVFIERKFNDFNSNSICNNRVIIYLDLDIYVLNT